MLNFIAKLLYKHLALPVAASRHPDFIVGDRSAPYLLRWYLTPWRAAYKDVPEADRTRWQQFVSCLPNLYLHCFLRSDDDRALHDHPWNWASLLLAGQYTEVTEQPYSESASFNGCDYMVIDVQAKSMLVSRMYTAGTLRWHRAEYAHRLVLPRGAAAWTLFFVGWRRRRWGFHCPKGWVPWEEFTDPETAGATVGRGCD